MVFTLCVRKLVVQTSETVGEVKKVCRRRKADELPLQRSW